MYCEENFVSVSNNWIYIDILDKKWQLPNISYEVLEKMKLKQCT